MHVCRIAPHAPRRLSEQHAGQCAGVAAVPAQPADEDVQQVILVAVGAGVPGEHAVAAEKGGFRRHGLRKLAGQQGLACRDQRKIVPGSAVLGEHVSGEPVEEPVPEMLTQGRPPVSDLAQERHVSTSGCLAEGQSGRASFAIGLAEVIEDPDLVQQQGTQPGASPAAPAQVAARASLRGAGRPAPFPTRRSAGSRRGCRAIAATMAFLLPVPVVDHHRDLPGNCHQPLPWPVTEGKSLFGVRLLDRETSAVTCAGDFRGRVG